MAILPGDTVYICSKELLLMPIGQGVVIGLAAHSSYVVRLPGGKCVTMPASRLMTTPSDEDENWWDE